MFKNQINCFKLANGDLIKFINHLSVLIDNSFSFLIEYAQKHYEKKLMIYFLNSNLKNVAAIKY